MEGTSIAVLCMNKPNILSQTINALHNTVVGPSEIIFVDNGSTDPETIALLKEQIDRGHTVIRNDENKGLSVGTNQGLEAGKYDTLIHLDDDCVIQTRGWNQMMRRYFDNPKIGMVTPQQGGEYIQHETYREIRWGLGMCWAIRKEIFDDIGGYDPALMHQNECDMALRVRMAGYHHAAADDFVAHHNDPGGPPSELAAARLHLGCVQFRDKWTQYFRGRDWNYGTQPLYLMQHWPPDQEFYRRYAISKGLDLNPPPDGTTPGTRQEVWDQLDNYAQQNSVVLDGVKFLIWRDLKNDYAHWEWIYNPHGYTEDRQKAIDKWYELTGELYEGYKWPHNLLRPY